jgi:hypothetical protein
MWLERIGHVSAQVHVAFATVLCILVSYSLGKTLICLIWLSPIYLIVSLASSLVLSIALSLVQPYP